MSTHLVRLHSRPQADIKCITSNTAKASSSILACDNNDATTPLTHTKSLSNDNIDDTTCLTRILDTTTPSFPQTESMTTPATPTTPKPPTTGVLEIEHNMMDNKAFDSNVPAQTASPKVHESHKKSRSRASSTSQRATRSASSSTAGNSRRPGTHSRTTSTQRQQIQQSPPGLHSRSSSIHMSPQRRDQLLALHRDSCRLFQPVANNINNNPIAIDTLALTHDETHLSPFTSPAASPVQRSHSFPFGFSADSDMSDEDLLPSSSASSRRYITRTATATSRILPDTIDTVPETPEQQQSHIPPATVITEWTSPSTRRREYEKIDRSNRGIRRIWRRLTPSCFQSGDNMRTPFFEEGNKKNYEGSVRRFRMDLPDDESNVSEKTKITSTGDGLLISGPKVEKGKWSCF